ncbi:MAG: MFS transporter [Paracoccaceae bacterium]
MAYHRPLCPDGRAALADGPCVPCAEAARPYVLAATILASAMAFIDGTLVHIALPAIGDDLGARFAALQWVVNAYALMLGALILVGGGLGDRFGRRRVFNAGIALFALASLACALAADAGVLIAARALQGIGAALLVPQSLAIIAAAFPREVRGPAIGLWAGASAVTTALGPPIGGLLIDTLSWRAAFWINLPLAALALWLSLRFVPESRDETARGPLDWPGGVAAVLGFGALSWGLTRLAEDADALAWGLLGLGVAAIAGFVAIEARVRAPLMPLGLFRDRTFAITNLATLLLYGALGAALFLLPFDFIARRGLDATEAGLALLPMGLLIGLLAQPMGRLADRLGARPFLAAGPIVVAVACLWLGRAFEGFALGALAPVALLAVGMAMVVAPLTTVVLNAAPDAQSGAASGVNNAASRLAGLLAVATCGALARAVYAAALPSGTAAPAFGRLPAPDDPGYRLVEAAFLDGYAAALGLAAAAALAAGLAMLATPPVRVVPAARIE